MVIYSVYIVSKSGGLIFNYDHNIPKIETEKTYSFPLEHKLVYQNKQVVVVFGQRNVGHVLLAVNGAPVNGRTIEDDKNPRDVFEVLENPENYPISLKFGRPKMSTNEKIFLASMFYPLFAIASQLSPQPRTSGIQSLEADTFRLYCFQTLTGVKFILIVEPSQTGADLLLHRIYELYADYALKNPFYSLEMPIRCDLFESNLQSLLEQSEKAGISSV
ncbi:Trafficking protein particle complex subunit 4 [Frankliniella fusca]|uniref:Trafficking protein particle complex subunit n=1 Tax=Frankliniella fusca TaxID=407009 RepID=A0AAE1HYX6_9NEOP|nr:Trafficking protein particle complex subunit 4 [Frankliniella fusca]